jgi:hypothetical protein
LKELGVDMERVSKCYFPLLLDTDVFTNNENAERDIDPYNKALLKPFKFIILHPSRINLDESRAGIDSGQWKGNDNLLKALAICIRKYKIEDACIAMPDRIYSPDISKAKKNHYGTWNRIKHRMAETPESAGIPPKAAFEFLFHLRHCCR